MIKSESIDFHSYLPPYRSLLNPNARYDYQTHSLIPLSQNEINNLNATLRKRTTNKDNSSKLITSGPSTTTNTTNNNNGGNNSFKMKYKSLLSDVSRSLSMRLSNPNLMANVSTTLSAAAAAAAAVHAATSSSNASISGSLALTTTTNNNNIIIQPPPPPPPPLQFKNLPVEIIDLIFFFIDSKSDYKACLYTDKLFYYFAKPYYYQDLQFTSTYRFAQFISYLRLNSEIGQYIKTIDLSNIKPGYDEDAEENNNVNNQNHNIEIDFQEVNHSNEDLHNTNSRDQDEFINDKILAGWRDWKFKNNPLYSIHPVGTSMSLTKISSNSQISVVSTTSSHKSFNSSSPNKRFKPFKYFKSKKRSKKSNPPKLEYLNLAANHHFRHHNDHSDLLTYANSHSHSSSVRFQSSALTRNSSPHPLINKFLLNYSTSKDIPVGYVLHLINLCPNVVSLNLANISLSIDYEISRAMVYKFQTFDLMNNYPKDIVHKIDEIMNLNDYFSEYGDNLSTLDGGCSTSLLLNDGNVNLPTNSKQQFQPSSSFQSSSQSQTPSYQQQQQQQQSTSSSSQPPPPFFQSNLFKSTQSNSSAASSVYSITTFSKPIRKYNSLLPPLPQTVNDISYLNKGDGKVYLSDLNLKSINNSYLTKLNETELLTAIIKMHGSKSPLIAKNSQRDFNYYNNYYTNMILNDSKFTITNLKYINLSSMIWLNKASIQKFLKNLIINKDRHTHSSMIFTDYESYDELEEEYVEDETSEENSLYKMNESFNASDYKQDLIIDLTDSGMYKNLQWAKIIDLNTKDGCKLVHKIINDELFDPFQDYMRRERIRRGRIGENYLAL
ncbi:hypothetical protein DFJ63DRAFT_336950 [Scheffersomyces coipomensis]|uniref:uncharacterized protein n=1 Tax=Scheffersomyces coipomensis TaxID=1788519 RepID=UPI00315CB001